MVLNFVNDLLYILIDCNNFILRSCPLEHFFRILLLLLRILAQFVTALVNFYRLDGWLHNRRRNRRRNLGDCEFFTHNDSIAGLLDWLDALGPLLDNLLVIEEWIVNHKELIVYFFKHSLYHVVNDGVEEFL